MASEKISAMSAAAGLDGTELIPIVQSGANVSLTTGNLLIASLPASFGSGTFIIGIGLVQIAGGAVVDFSTGILKVTTLQGLSMPTSDQMDGVTIWVDPADSLTLKQSTGI